MKRLVLLAVIICVVAAAGSAYAGKDDPWSGIISNAVVAGAEPFAYPNGNLVGNSPWYGDAGSAIFVDTQELGIASNSSADQKAHWDVSYSGVDGMIWVGIKLASGAGEGSFFWDLYAFDTAGGQLGRFYGKENMARGRTDYGAPWVTAEYYFGSSYVPIWMQIDTVNHVTSYYGDGAFLGSLNNSGGTTLGKITLNSWNRGQDDFIVWADNLAYGTVVVPEPSSIAALGTLCLGALGFVRRRR